MASIEFGYNDVMRTTLMGWWCALSSYQTLFLTKSTTDTMVSLFELKIPEKWHCCTSFFTRKKRQNSIELKVTQVKSNEKRELILRVKSSHEAIKKSSWQWNGTFCSLLMKWMNGFGNEKFSRHEEWQEERVNGWRTSCVSFRKWERASN